MHFPICDADSKYIKLQEALRKNIQRCFGVSQAPLHIFCKDIHYWDEKYIVCVSGVWVTLYNMLVQMN